MKKALSVLLVMLMAISMLTISTSAFERIDEAEQIPTTNVDIVLDGKKDAVYNHGLLVKADGVQAAPAGTDCEDYADYYFLWKPEGLYVFIECHDRDVHDSDATLAASGCQIWETDHACVDIAWDADSRDTYYQYSMTTSSKLRMWTDQGFLGSQAYESAEDQENLKSSYIDGYVDLTPEYGYNIELFLKAEPILEEKLSAGMLSAIQAEYISVDSSFCVDPDNAPDNFGGQRYVKISGGEFFPDSLKTNTHQPDLFTLYQMSNKIVDENGDAGTTEPEETKAPETKAPETKAPETKAPETKAPAEDTKAATDTVAPTEEPANNNMVLWIVIGAVAVVAIVVVVVVVTKKKKK